MIDAAMDHNLSQQLSRPIRRDMEQPQNRFGRMPMLPECRLGPLNTSRSEFPVSMKPIRVANHDNKPILRMTIGRRLARRRNLANLSKPVAKLFESLIRLHPRRASA